MSKHRATHRMVRRRGRVGALGLAVAVTIAIGGAAVGILPQLKADRAAGRHVSGARPRGDRDRGARHPRHPGTGAQAARGRGQRHQGRRAARRIGHRLPDRLRPERSARVAGQGRRLGRAYVPRLGQPVQQPAAGSYRVQSKTRSASAFDGSGTMEYFVRSPPGSASRSVPQRAEDNTGKLEQTKAQLGTPLSAGCVRQWLPDAIALWDSPP